MATRKSTMKESNYKLENAYSKIWDARMQILYVPTLVHEFLDYVGRIIKKDVSPNELVYGIERGLKDIRTNSYRVPDILRGKYDEVNVCMKYIPLVIDRIGSIEFARKFRKSFGQKHEEMLESLPEENAKFEVKILSDGGIDISHKDIAEVLAKLYAYACTSKPFAREYKKGNISIEQAREVLKHSSHVHTLFGHIINIDFSSETIYVRAYNVMNGFNMATIAISQCKDIK